MRHKSRNHRVALPFAIVPGFLIVASPAAVKVYVALALHANHNTGECWPSHRTLAAETQLSVATIKRALKELETIGAISITHRVTESGDLTSNLYKLSFAVNKPVDNQGGGFTSDLRVGSPVSEEPDSDEPYIASLVEKMPREVGEAIADYIRRLSEGQRNGQTQEETQGEKADLASPTPEGLRGTSEHQRDGGSGQEEDADNG